MKCTGRRRSLSILLVALAVVMTSFVSCKKQQEEESGPAYLGEGEISDELPVTRVALYQNGVGYFERRGRIEGDSLKLRIRPDQINDILKSLTIIDLGEGRPVSISLPVDRNAIDAMASIPEQIREDGGILSLLQAFRGAKVTVNGKGGAVTGRVVGLENTGAVTGDGHEIEEWRVTIMQADGLLRILDVADLASVDIQDKTLEVGLDKSLDISLNEGSWKPIELEVRLTEGGARDVLVSYIVSMPVWKPAYRLVLGEDESGLFQGWAVVDNVSGSSWENIEMALVAGEPMSFVYDLYQPQFVSRPDLTPRGGRHAIAPPVIESAQVEQQLKVMEKMEKLEEGEVYEEMERKERRRGKKLSKSASSSGSGYGGLVLEEQKRELAADLWEPEEPVELADYEANFDTAASGSELSALFRYDIGAPVTVPDRSSALVNLVQSKSESREIALFRPSLYGHHDALHPYRAVEFHNQSGYALEKGPITLYRDGAFIGEGMLQPTEIDEVAFVTFAMDPQVSLKTYQSDSEEAASIQRIEGGVIYSEVKSVTTVSYEITNSRKEAMRAMVSRPQRSGWTLEPKPEGTLDAAGSHFIPVDVAAGETKKVEIREVTPVKRELSLDSSLALDLLQLQIKKANLEPALLEKLTDVIAKQNELGVIRAEEIKISEAKTLNENELSRITNSILDLKDIKEKSAKKLREELLARARGLESDIGKQSTRLTELRIAETDLELTLRALFQSITFDPGGDAGDQRK